MGAQRIKSLELTPDDLDRIEALEEERGVPIPPYLIGEVALTLAQQEQPKVQGEQT